MLKKTFFNFDISALKKYALNTSWLIIEKVLRVLSGIFIGFYVAHYLGDALFGKLNFAMSLVFLFGAISGFGLTDLLLKELLNRPEKRDTIMATSFFLRLIGGLISFILINTVSLFLNNDTSSIVIVLTISFNQFFISFDVLAYYFYSNVISKHVVKAQVISLIFSAIFKLTCVLLKLSIYYFAISILFESIVLGIGLFVIFRKHNQTISFKFFDYELAKSLAKSAFPLLLHGIMVSIYIRIDQVMITMMLGDSANGDYALATRVSEAWNYIPLLITSSLHPAIINAKNSSSVRYKKRMQQLYDLLFILSILVAIFFTFTADYIFSFVGKDYIESGAVLRVHIWGGLFVALNAASSKWLITENFNNFIFYRSALGCVSNIILNLILIPKYHILGAAYATILSQFIAGYLSFLLKPQAKEIWIMKTKSMLGISIIQQIIYLLKSRNK